MKEFSHYRSSASPDLKKTKSLWSYTGLDFYLCLFLSLLIVAGLFMLYSATGENVERVIDQAKHFALGLFIMIFLAQLSPKFIENSAFWLYLIGLFLLLLVAFIGVEINNTKRWLSIAGIGFQPSELMKLALPLMAAAYLAPRALPPSFKYVFVTLAIIFIPVLMIVRQPDLGTGIMIACTGLFVLFLSGLNWRYIASALLLLITMLPLLWNVVLKGYQKQRVLTFLNPERDPLGAGWNIIQSKTAIGAGGNSGKGWLEGSQSQLNFLPEPHTDFIVAVIAEEQGLIGISLLLILYFAIIARGLWLARSITHSFGRLLAGSIILTFFTYLFVNLGMVSGILPVVGVPLPLISYGGSSIVSLLAGFGLLMSMHNKNIIMMR